jgi:hypothetical protein
MAFLSQLQKNTGGGFLGSLSVGQVPIVTPPQLTTPSFGVSQSTPQISSQGTPSFFPVDIAIGTGQAMARTVGSVGITAGNLPFNILGQQGPFQETISTKDNPVTSTVFGGEPVQTISKNIADVQKKIEPYIGETASKFTATPLVLGGIALDLSGFGGGKAVTSFTKGEVPEAFFKFLSKEVKPATIESTLKSVGFEESVIKKLTPDLVKADTPQAVKDIFLEFEKGTAVNPPLKLSSEGIPLALTERQKALVGTGIDKNLPPLTDNVPKFVREPDIPVPDSMVGLLKRNITPLKFVDESTQKILRDWNSERIVGKEMANQTASNVRIEGDGMDLIHRYQAGEQLPQTTQIKQIFDDLRKEALARGLEVKERQNYIPQVYKGSPIEIQSAVLKYITDHGVSDEMARDYVAGIKPLPEDVANRLKLSPTFEKERVFASYKVAEEYGLTPKYDKISDLAAHYRDEMNKAIANQKLITSLVEGGKIMPTGNAPKEWIPLNTQFSVKTHYSAPANTAKIINDIFANPDLAGLGAKVVHVGAVASKGAQEIALSAGIPNTTVNFFAIGQLVKELTAGNFKSVSAFLRANLNSATVKFFEKHKQTLLDMAEQNIDVTNRVGSFNQKSFIELLKTQEFKKAIGHGLDIAFGKKTFESFMPMMQVQLFEDIVKSGIKKGLSPEEAKIIAGDTLRKNFGLNTDAFAQGQLTKDTLSAVFFAPRFRESIIRTLFQTGKAGGNLIKYIGTAGKSKLDPSSARNQLLLGGMILTFAVYDLMNRQLNDGQDMWENPAGKEFSLRIPTENGEVIYLEFMPSFLAFARNMASGGIALAKGDFNTAGQKFGSVFSMPLKITSEVLTNRDYFGNPIYKDSDTTLQKTEKLALYTGLAVNHPYIKEAVNQIQDKKPLYQSVITALELPLKFSTKDKESTSAFYNAMDERAKEAAREKEKFAPTFNEIQNLIRSGKTNEAKSMLNSLTDAQYELYKTMKTSLKTSTTFSGKAKMYDTYNVMQEMIKNGKSDEAKTILNSFSEDEYKYYQLLKKQFGEKKAVVSKTESKSLLSKVYESTIGPKTAEASVVPEQKSYWVRNNEIKDTDLDEARSILFAEISNRTKDKQSLEAQTILNTAFNRMEQYNKDNYKGKSDWTLLDVLREPQQYQGYQSGEYKRIRAGDTNETDKQKLAAIDEMIAKVKDGTFKNNIPGYRFYVHKPDGRIVATNSYKGK